MANVKNRQCLQGHKRIGGPDHPRVRNHPETKFPKKQNFGTPRISIRPENNDFPSSHAILTPSGDFAPGQTWQSATLGNRPHMRPMIFDMRFV